jgi:hypothetical protein
MACRGTALLYLYVYNANDSVVAVPFKVLAHKGTRSAVNAALPSVHRSATGLLENVRTKTLYYWGQLFDTFWLAHMVWNLAIFFFKIAVEVRNCCRASLHPILSNLFKTVDCKNKFVTTKVVRKIFQTISSIRLIALNSTVFDIKCHILKKATC